MYTSIRTFYSTIFKDVIFFFKDVIFKKSNRQERNDFGKWKSCKNYEMFWRNREQASVAGP